MKRSTGRIITTHVGSLPRPERLEALLIQRDHGRPIDQSEFVREVDSALDYVIEKQIDSGVDVGNDGEQPRVGFQTYVTERMSGFSGVSERKMLTDMVRFPKYAKMFTDRTWSPDRERPKVFNAPQATGQVRYEPDLKDVQFEMAAFRRAINGRAGRPPSSKRS
jgi:5-methyltetrahydropteroyltriglutamate--homocysteine methyltransferase